MTSKIAHSCAFRSRGTLGSGQSVFRSALLSIALASTGCGRIGYNARAGLDVARDGEGTSDGGASDDVATDAQRVDGADVLARDAGDASVTDGGDGGGALVLGDRLSAGQGHTCVVRSGELWCWGSNEEGQLGVGDRAPRDRPVRVDPNADWQLVAAGAVSTCGSRRSAGVWCWGDNSQRQLGFDDAVRRMVPTRLDWAVSLVSMQGDFGTVCGASANGALHCWGDNDEGQLAQNDPFPGPGVDRSAAVEVPGITAPRSIGTSQGSTCAIDAAGRLFCWGRNSNGEVGIGTIDPAQLRTPQRVGAFSDWSMVDGGQSHACGLREGGELWCWGENDGGQLGVAGMARSLVPVRVGTEADWTWVSANALHTCGVRRPGTLWCWGRNVEGQLGVGDFSNRTTPTRAGTATDYTQVSAGRFHTCALRTDGAVLCAGENAAGQLGQGDAARRENMTIVRF
jgi:alpha-tubulin suppressor-like RCC1 family protein